jgi:DNA-binding response OmpR family regulator
MKTKKRTSHQKTVLLVDDEQGFLEALADGLELLGFRILKAVTVEKALDILEREKIDLITVDIMLDPGESLKEQTDSHEAGIYLCGIVRKKYPLVDVFCISVLSDVNTIKSIERMGVPFLRKGETPLRTVLGRLSSRLGGVAYST